MQQSLVKNIQNKPSTTMTGFTLDFFDALDTTLNDKSLNNSKFNISEQDLNKSQYLRQLRQQSIVKMQQLISKMIKTIIFNDIFYQGIKKQRNKLKTSINIHKHYYKIQLLFNIKSRAKLQWAFYRIYKFIPQLTGKNIIPSQFHHQCHQNKENNAELIKQKEKILNTTKQTKINHFVRKFINIIEKNKLTLYFNKVKYYVTSLEKKSYFIQYLFLLSCIKIRQCFLALQNFQKNNTSCEKKIFQQQTICLLQQKSEPDNHDVLHEKDCVIKQSDKISVEKQKTEIKINKEKTKCENILYENQYGNMIKKPTSGLKFNKRTKPKSEIIPQKQLQKKKSQLSQISNGTEQLNVNVKFAKKTKIQPMKAIGIVNSPSDKNLLRSNLFLDFSSFKHIRSINHQQLKEQLTDLQYINTDIKHSQSILNKKNVDKKVTFNKRPKKSNSKRSLQLWSEGNKSKVSQISSKSKKSSRKSSTSKLLIRNSNSINTQYFPELKTFKSTKQIQSSQYIGNTEWNRKEKRRVSTEQTSNLKTTNNILSPFSPYFEVLKKDISSKTPEKLIKSSKLIQKNNSQHFTTIPPKSAQKQLKPPLSKQQSNTNPPKQHLKFRSIQKYQQRL